MNWGFYIVVGAGVLLYGFATVEAIIGNLRTRKLRKELYERQKKRVET